MSAVDSFLNDLWQCYYSMNSQVPKIHGALEQHGETAIENDHIAFRTYAVADIGIEVMRKPFEDLGWRKAGDYHFEQKKLRAIHLERANSPKIFLSELLVDQFSESLQKIVASELEHYKPGVIDVKFLTSGRLQAIKPNYTTYKSLLAESEYAAWMYIFGICPNHFTVYVNSLQKFANIELLNSFLLGQGFVMNEVGGIVKGTVADGLRQSSTLAAEVEVEFDDSVVRAIPCCYYEFAERFEVAGELFQGFVTSSADKIFQSTDSK